jgi:hypothetical protein
LRWRKERRDRARQAPTRDIDMDTAAFLPARRVPLLYFAYAHVCLAAAFFLVAINPTAAGGFYYHPRLVGIVHLVTLGWISGSILGALYLVAPLAFRLALPERRLDYAAFISFAIGVTGMVTHFWLEPLSAVAWAAVLVVAAVLWVGGRVLHGLRTAPVPGEARLPMGLAIVNMLAAALAGMLLAMNKAYPFLPAAQLDGVIGHAHLAAVGWGVLMVMGAGYRLLPMILPAAMPRGAGPYAATILTQAGTWGLFLALLTSSPAAVAPRAATAALGIAVFLAHVGWMLRHRRPAPPERLRPDLSVAHVGAALACCVAAAAIGTALAFAPPSEATLRWAMAYGVLGLVGFLSQMVVGVAGRLVPLYGWLWGFADRDYHELPPSLHRVLPRPAQAVTLALWTAGIPALAAGLALDRPLLTGTAAAALGVAVLTSGLALAIALRRLWHR